MKTYIATYTKGQDSNFAYFKADSVKEAKELASFHKRHTPELKGYKISGTKLDRP